MRYASHAIAGRQISSSVQSILRSISLIIVNSLQLSSCCRDRDYAADACVDAVCCLIWSPYRRRSLACLPRHDEDVTLGTKRPCSTSMGMEQEALTVISGTRQRLEGSNLGSQPAAFELIRRVAPFHLSCSLIRRSLRIT
jgi:hypothetical protein